MNVLLVHPSGSKYNDIYFRLEPLGLELVGRAVREAGHNVRLLDLQLFSHQDYLRELRDFSPHAVGFSANYLATIPEVLDLAVETKRLLPECFVFIGGHCATFIPNDLLQHGRGAVDAVVRGEGEEITPRLLEAIPDGNLETLPGLVTLEGTGPKPQLLESIEKYSPDRSLLRRPNKYFMGMMDPCASMEFTRGCPWDCSFCSAWTFYGRSYRKVSPELVVERLAQLKEPNVFIVDDVAFIHPEDGFAIGREIEKRGIRKRYWLETRCDVFLRNLEVFKYWQKLGLHFFYLGIEAIDEEGLKFHRKRASMDSNVRALEEARKLGVRVIANIVADPGWDAEQFRIVREWVDSVPEIVHMSVNTPYPGTESWITDSRKLSTLDYRLFDTYHAIHETKLPLDRFYVEVVETQAIIMKHLGFDALRKGLRRAAGNLLRGQVNFLQMLWKFRKVFEAKAQYADHFQEVKYEITPPVLATEKPTRDQLYVHAPMVAESAAARASPRRVSA